MTPPTCVCGAALERVAVQWGLCTRRCGEMARPVTAAEFSVMPASTGCSAGEEAPVDEYEALLASKRHVAAPAGFDAPTLSSSLFPFQREIVRWALRQGRAGAFADCGLGKTIMQLEWAQRVAEHTDRPMLIIAPLAVAGQTVREGKRFGIDVTYARGRDEQAKRGITITNYEMHKAFSPADFGGVVLDESSILKSYMGSTKRAILDAFAATPYRLACTATPAPNDTLELGNHAEFLGALTSHEMIARWFLPDTGAQAGTYRLKGHAVEPYWDWVTSWARCLGKPSDLGFSDAGYTLPPIERHVHQIDVDVMADRGDRLFREPSLSATSVHKEKRRTAGARAKGIAELVRAEPSESWILWCDTDYEDDELRAVLPEAESVRGSDSLEEKERKLLGFSDGSIRWLITKPRIGGFGLNWQHCARAAYVGPTFSFEQLYQTERRIYRFGQERPVHTHVVMASTEVNVWAVAMRKAAQHAAMAVEMFAAARRARERGEERARAYEPTHEGRLPAWLERRAG